jgi:prepilin-type N-terminal cleavage/methylation domain-containing protein
MPATFGLKSPRNPSPAFDVATAPGTIVNNIKLILAEPLLMRRTKAFTLIELLVVVAIIGVLIAILVPSLGRVRSNAKKTICKSNLHAWGIALQTYAAEYNAFMGTALSASTGSASLPNNVFWNPTPDGEFYLAGINQYIGNSFDPVNKRIGKIGICPSIDVTGFGEFAHNDWVNGGPYQRFNISYSYYAGVNRWPAYNTEVANQPGDQSRSTPANTPPGRIMMADNVWYHNGNKGWFFNHAVGGGIVNGYQMPVTSGAIPVEGLHHLMADGHVEWKSYSNKNRLDLANFSLQTRVTQSSGNYPFFY